MAKLGLEIAPDAINSTLTSVISEVDLDKLMVEWSGEFLAIADAPIITASRSVMGTLAGGSQLISLGQAATGLGITSNAPKEWNINGPGSTNKWQGPGNNTYTEFGKDETVWSRSHSNHGGEEYKVYKKGNKGLEWEADADKYGNYIKDKHKSRSGKFISWKSLRKIF